MDKLTAIEQKIFTSPEELRFRQMLAYWRFKGLKIVFSNGCFDIIHRGHVAYLAKAASLGDVLILGVNDDDSVKRLKGAGRPVNSLDARTLVLASFQFVSAIVPFHEDTPIKLISGILPDILVKGADYKAEEIVGYDVVIAHGGKVETIDLVEGFSTTAIVNRLSDNR